MAHHGAPFEYVWKLLVLGEPLYIHGAADRWQWPPHPRLLFPLSWPVCFLMYLSVQLVQIASSITGTRYENVDPCTRAQTHCYECNLEASSGGGPPPGYCAMRGSVASGYEGVRDVRGRRRRGGKTLYLFILKVCFCLKKKKKQLWRIGGVSVDKSNLSVK